MSKKNQKRDLSIILERIRSALDVKFVIRRLMPNIGHSVFKQKIFQKLDWDLIFEDLISLLMTDDEMRNFFSILGQNGVTFRLGQVIFYQTA